MAGLGATLGFPQVTNWFDPRRAQLLALASGLASSPDFGQAVSNGFAGAAQAKQADDANVAAKQAEAERQQQINQTQQWIAKNYPQYGSLPANEGFQLALEDLKQKNAASLRAPVDPTETYQGRLDAGQAQGLTGNDLATYALTGKLPGGNQTPRAGLGQPLPYKNRKTGEYIAVEPMTDGTAVDLATGQPVDPAQFVYDPLGMAGAKTGVVADAKTSAAARTALPGAEQSYAVTQNTLRTLTSDPSVLAGQKENFGKLLGVYPQQMAPSIPGTNRANFLNIVDQLSGQAFLNIRQALKGAGQVTDYEGQKGEIALSRMKAAAEKGDENAFMQAVADYQQAIDNGMALLRQQAQGDFSAGQPAVTGTPGPSGPDPEIENILKGVGL